MKRLIGHGVFRTVKPNLAIKFAHAAALVMLVPIGILITISYLTERGDAIATEKARIQAYAAAIAVEIDTYIISQKNITQFAVLSGELRELLAAQAADPSRRPDVNKWLRYLSGLSQNLLAVYVVDTGGHCIASSDPAFIGNDLSFRSYFQEAMKGRTFVSDWTVGTTAGVPGIYMSAPIFSGRGSIEGVFVMKLDTAPVDAVIARHARLGVAGFVSNRAGVTLSHYLPAQRYRTIGDLTEAERVAIDSVRQFGDAPLVSEKLESLRSDIGRVGPGKTVLSAEYQFHGDRKIAALSGLNSLDWVVGVAVSFPAIEASANQLLLLYIPLLLVLIVLTAIAAWYVARFIVRPLNVLLEKVEQVSAGNYEVEVKVSGDDELVRLSHAFNAMTAKVRADRDQLEARVKERTVALQLALEENRHLSLIDPLTGCCNRRQMDERLNQDLAHARRYGRALSVIMADIDYFKRVNDRFGHAAGDVLLVAVARVLRENVRDKVDWVVRFGGEEFLLVLPETQLADAAVFAERLRAKVADLDFRPVDGRELVTVSFGVTAVRPGSAAGETVASLLERADMLLYRAKNEGRNRVVCDPDQLPLPAEGLIP